GGRADARAPLRARGAGRQALSSEIPELPTDRKAARHPRELRRPDPGEGASTTPSDGRTAQRELTADDVSSPRPALPVRSTFDRRTSPAAPPGSHAGCPCTRAR